MNRRSFFAWLLAPFVTKALPNVQHVGRNIMTPAQLEAAYNRAMFGSKTLEWVFALPVEAQDEKFRHAGCDGQVLHVLRGSNIIVSNPRSGFRLHTKDGVF